MGHLRELLRSQLLQNVEVDASVVDVSRTVETLVASLMDGFDGPNDPTRARFPQLHQHANMHREARTHTILIADTGARSYADSASPAQLTATSIASARVDKSCRTSVLPLEPGQYLRISFRRPTHRHAGSRCVRIMNAGPARTGSPLNQAMPTAKCREQFSHACDARSPVVTL
eukprot:591684-Pleurochrysis_carterae.AAC.1